MVRKWIVLLMLLVGVPAYAEEADVASAVEYVAVSPEIVTNIGDRGRLRYLRVRASVRVSEPGAADAVRYHMPYVRDLLVRILAQQDPDEVLNPDVRQQIRVEALAELNAFFTRDGGAALDDLLFTEYLVQ